VTSTDAYPSGRSLPLIVSAPGGATDGSSSLSSSPRPHATCQPPPVPYHAILLSQEPGPAIARKCRLVMVIRVISDMAVRSPSNAACNVPYHPLACHPSAPPPVATSQDSRRDPRRFDRGQASAALEARGDSGNLIQETTAPTGPVDVDHAPQEDRLEPIEGSWNLFPKVDRGEASRVVNAVAGSCPWLLGVLPGPGHVLRCGVDEFARAGGTQVGDPLASRAEDRDHCLLQHGFPAPRAGDRHTCIISCHRPTIRAADEVTTAMRTGTKSHPSRAVDGPRETSVSRGTGRRARIVASRACVGLSPARATVRRCKTVPPRSCTSRQPTMPHPSPPITLEPVTSCSQSDLLGVCLLPLDGPHKRPGGRRKWTVSPRDSGMVRWTLWAGCLSSGAVAAATPNPSFHTRPFDVARCSARSF
jgi:hypothetical protein